MDDSLTVKEVQSFEQLSSVVAGYSLTVDKAGCCSLHNFEGNVLAVNIFEDHVQRALPVNDIVKAAEKGMFE